MSGNNPRPVACPECGNRCLTIDSSSAMRKSSIYCSVCEHEMIGECNEETLIERWNKAARAAAEGGAA
jgi:hypothetical protein